MPIISHRRGKQTQDFPSPWEIIQTFPRHGSLPTKEYSNRRVGNWVSPRRGRLFVSHRRGRFHRRGSLLLPIAVGERLPSPIAVGDRSIVSHRRGKPTRYSHAVGASPPRDILFGEWEIGSPTAARDFLIPYRCGSMPTISHRRGRQARGFPSPWETTRYFHRGALP